MATNDENSQGIEDTSSPLHERRESIDKKLQRRPTQDELKEKNILLNTNAAPALQASQHDLEKQQTTDELRKKLTHRPERDELVNRNILADSNVAPSLQANQKELAKHMRQDSLEKQIQSRPNIQELVDKNILTPKEAKAPAAEAIVDDE